MKRKAAVDVDPKSRKTKSVVTDQLKYVKTEKKSRTAQPLPPPVNFDFGRDWDNKVVPHLDHPRIKSAITKGVNNFLKTCWDGKDRYKEGTSPASHTNSDGFVMLMDRIADRRMNELKRQGLGVVGGMSAHRDNDDNDDDNDDEEGDELTEEAQEAKEEAKFKAYNEAREKLETDELSFAKTRHKIYHYVLFHSCHWWARTFELELARLVEPNERWRIRSGPKHTTVVNRGDTKVFDLLFWAAIGGRLQHHLFGDALIESCDLDVTLGGAEAYRDSFSKASRRA